LTITEASLPSYAAVANYALDFALPSLRLSYSLFLQINGMVYLQSKLKKSSPKAAFLNEFDNILF